MYQVLYYPYYKNNNYSKKRQIKHKRHYEQFADGTVKDIEDEIPFDVPDGWAWCRLPSICRKAITDGTHNSPTTYDKGDFLYITAKNIKADKIDLSNVSYVSREIHEEIYNRCPPELNDVLLTKDGTIGEVAVNNLQEPFSLLSSVALIKPANNILPWYIAYVLKSNYLQSTMRQSAKGVALKRIILEQINTFLIPLPPFAEQERIVLAIEQFFNQINILEESKSDLEIAIKQAKSKILDLAIHGKLVPQDPNDEPAEELLKRIATSDNRPYKKFDGEEPFDIPALWSWCRLGEICDYGKCINVNSSDLKADDWILDLEDIEKDSGRIIAFHNFEERKSESTKHKFLKGQVLYSKLRPYLNKVVISPKDGFCTSEILPLDFKSILLPRYAQVLLMSSYFLEMVNMVTYGVKMPRLGTNDAKNMQIPVPSRTEQQRIVSKIEEIFSYLDTISSNLE